MTLSEYARSLAGRWAPRYDEAEPTEPVAAAARIGAGAVPPHSTPRPACTLMRGEWVLVDGCWREVAEVSRLRAPGAPAQTLLRLTDGGILGSRFDYTYVSRDADEQAAAGNGGAA